MTFKMPFKWFISFFDLYKLTFLFIFFHHSIYYYFEGKEFRLVSQSAHRYRDSHFVAIFLMINIVSKYMSLSEHSLIHGKAAEVAAAAAANNEIYGINNNKAVIQYTTRVRI